MAEKRYPFQGQSIAQLHASVLEGSYRPLQARGQQVARLVAMALRLEPRDRPTAGDLVAYLEMRESVRKTPEVAMLATIAYKQPTFFINKDLPKSNFQGKKEFVYGKMK